jgi:hypothetical protein
MIANTIGKDIDKQWHWIEPLLTKCFVRNPDGYTADDALEDIHSGRSFMLVFSSDTGEFECACLMDVHPGALHVRTWTGKGMDRWLTEAIQIINGIARGLGKAKITSISRPGAARILQRKAGWKIKDHFMVSEVTE